MVLASAIQVYGCIHVGQCPLLQQPGHEHVAIVLCTETKRNCPHNSRMLWLLSSCGAVSEYICGASLRMPASIHALTRPPFPDASFARTCARASGETRPQALAWAPNVHAVHHQAIGRTDRGRPDCGLTLPLLAASACRIVSMPEMRFVYLGTCMNDLFTMPSWSIHASGLVRKASVTLSSEARLLNVFAVL